MTAAHGETMSGITANSFSSVSLEPPLVLWSLDREAGSLRGFLDAPGFAVNFLAAEQRTVSDAFAQSGEKDWSIGDWSKTPNGHPWLAGGLGTLDCLRHSIFDGGDHLILVGRVTSLLGPDTPKGDTNAEPGDVGRRNSQIPDPLLYFRGGYRGIAPRDS